MSAPNPYTTPNGANAHSESENQQERSDWIAITRRIFLAWEKLRILYIGCLGLVTLALIPTSEATLVQAALIVVAGAVATNLLYLAGPAVESYVAWLTSATEVIWLRWTLFLTGTIIATVLAFLTLAGPLLPTPQ